MKTLPTKVTFSGGHNHASAITLSLQISLMALSAWASKELDTKTLIKLHLPPRKQTILEEHFDGDWQSADIDEAGLREAAEYLDCDIVWKNHSERRRIGSELAKMRAKKGLTQADIEYRTGIKQTHVSRIECGKYSVGFDTLQSYADAIGCYITIKECRK